MSVTREDASESLVLIKVAEKRSRMLRGYRKAAPHLFLWGGIYAAAYGYGYFRPEQAGLAWAALIPVGMAAGALLARGGERAVNWQRFIVLMSALFAFITATIAVMRPAHPQQIGAFVPLVVALAYVFLGLAVGWRFLITGAALGALTLIGFFAVPDIFMLWMAVVGGSALALGGLWLRRA